MKNRLVWGTGIWLIKISFLFILLCRLSVASLPAQSLNLKNEIADSLTRIANQSIFVGQVGVDNISIDQKSKKVIVSANEKLGYIPFRNENVRQIYVALNNILRPQYKKYDIVCRVDNKPIEELIPNFFRSRNKIDEDRFFVVKKPKFPLVKNLSRPYMVSNGLSGKNIALWASHGLYFDQKLLRWEWQRARVMQTVEDLYTLSYVYPFLMPMLENAGATVLTPRERDTQCHEIIVDNDIADSSEYHEFNQTEIWSIGKTAGFASSKNFYLQGENPFKMGSYRQISSVSNKKKISFAEWKPNIPETGKYAVYVSYNSLENSTSEAHYTVYHQGGETEFSVNQTMGGGTWIYLGQFYFHKGKNDNGKVVLTNLTGKKGETVTADAVKFGGGMGNIARFFNQKGTIPNQKSSDKTAEIAALLRPDSAFDWKYQPQTSGYPRFSEGARYWLQWAGFPDSIYSPTKGANDYVDDYQSRSKWVNYLIGGSILDAEGTGLKIPVDLSFAFHTDAGVTKNDSVIGTLGICAVNNFSGKDIFKNNVSRWTSRDLTDMVQTQIVNDIRLMCDTQWTRRGIWNKPYYEAKGPEVPAMLLELLSHQNFADMRYGLDPQFQFLVCRSIYKGILKYLSFSENRNYTVQPLPVTDFSVQFIDSISVKLQWKSRKDPYEPTAEADHFVVYSRTEEGAFDNGVLVNTSQYTLKLKPGTIYSFKVTAVNKGGESFPSEILSVYRDPNEKGTVLIVNGFQRVSAPSSFAIDTTYAGFLNTVDA
ncbi:MAG TPA: fibronectin type III domain-containing protein, partial [Paludibacteraceae bacterium]|nr:fibronectin type III domain-containing protein [Paludibacteraceae bacterium]